MRTIVITLEPNGSLSLKLYGVSQVEAIGAVEAMRAILRARWIRGDKAQDAIKDEAPAPRSEGGRGRTGEKET